MLKVKSRVQLRKSDRKKLFEGMEEKFGKVARLEESKIESARADDMEVLIVDGKILFFKYEGDWHPTVRGVLEYDINEYLVVVDQGAVKFVINGADIMSPGIVSADPVIKEGDIVVIKEEAHNKPLAIGKALVPGTRMVADSGKAVESLHYVGDEFWNLEL